MKKSLYVAIAIFILVFSPIIWGINDFTSDGSLEKPVTVVFPPNTHFTTIVDMLAENGVIRHPFLFKVILFANGQSSHVKAGEYYFSAYMPAKDVASLLAYGKTVVHHFTVPEGLMTSEILEMLKNNSLLSGDITLDVKEGELLPETYNFSRDDKRNDLVMRMRHAMQKTLEDAWEGRAANLPFTTSDQALTLASIVEKETGLVTERSRVAAVYINRLKKGMLLQADPTTAYAVTGGKTKLTRPLNHNDLALNSPYNTYRIPGLPPGPIANPGKASILATLHPVQSDELYFVATGVGGHNFARTMEEHNKNVQRYREAMKK